MSNTLAKWDPFKELNEFQNRLSMNFGGGRTENGDPSEGLTGLSQAEWQPAVDISEDEKEYLITADLPEVKKEEVHVGVNNGVLTMTGERKSEAEEKNEKKKFHRIERSYGRYVRTFRLPEDVDSEGIAADFKEGVLRVHLPKSEGAGQKKIEVL